MSSFTDEDRKLAGDALYLMVVSAKFEELCKILETLHAHQDSATETRRIAKEFYGYLHNARNDAAWGGHVRLAIDTAKALPVMEQPKLEAA